MGNSKIYHFGSKKRGLRRMLYGLQTIGVLIGISRVTSKTSEESLKKNVPIQKTDSLADLFTKFGSDKAIMHDYWKLYEPELMSMASKQIRILELGLGTNNPNIPSNMGGNFVPCGSLRAFREFVKNAEIFGADIDREILVQEERIKTCWVNQLSHRSFKGILQMTEHKGLDMVIVDGLHQPYADLVSVSKILPYIKIKGVMYIEDIENSKVVKFFWRFCSLVLPRKRFTSELIPMQGGLVYKIERLH